MQPNEGITQLLIDWGKGDQAALEKLMPLVYSELRRLASNYLRRERGEHTLQPTALVNEAYLKLVDQRNPKWQNRAHFFGISAQLMRRILVDHARQHQAAKRGGSEQQRISITGARSVAKQPEVDLLALNEALDELAQNGSAAEPYCGTEVFWRSVDRGNCGSAGNRPRHGRARLENGACVAPAAVRVRDFEPIRARNISECQIYDRRLPIWTIGNRQ